MRLVTWLVFVVVFVAGPLLLAQWREAVPVDDVGRLPNPRGRQRSAPEEAAQRDRFGIGLRALAVVAALIAAAWLIIGLSVGQWI